MVIGAISGGTLGSSKLNLARTGVKSGNGRAYTMEVLSTNTQQAIYPIEWAL